MRSTRREASSRPVAFAVRWVAMTNVALLLVIGLVQAGDQLGQGPVVIGAAATAAAWAASTVMLTLEWLVPARAPAWVEIARRAGESSRGGGRG